MSKVKRISVFIHGPNKKIDMVEAAHLDRVTAERNEAIEDRDAWKGTAETFEDFYRKTETERDAALAELKRYQSLFNQSEKTLDRVHCMYMKRLLDLTGEPQVALVPDEEFVKYFEELKTLKRENSGLQQRLTAADERVDVLESALRELLAGTGNSPGANRKYGRARAVLAGSQKQSAPEPYQGIPGTSFQRLNALANQGE